ncbi:MAG: hypothetical protein MK082_07045 [Phycisphaerales bacterium]|nr:hypothetical protein [Phycisphaerales bacterium]
MRPLTGLVTCLLFATSPLHGQDSAQDDRIGRLKASVTGSGPHETAKLRERDGIRNGPGYDGATIHYPTDAEGPLPGIVIVPGFMASERSVSRWGPFLASHGIVTMTIGTNQRNAMPEARADALLDAVTTLEAENTRKESPLNGRLDTERIGVGGWSMGGGGAQQAAVQDPDLDVVLALCPWKPGHSFNHPVPVMILAGEDDTPAPPSMHALVHFRKTPDTTPRLYYEVRDGSHSLAYSPTNADGDVGRIALTWLKCFLSDEEEYLVLLEEEPRSAKRFLLELPDEGPPNGNQPG